MGIKQMILVRARGLSASVASALCVVAVLTACGQKGNLYLPPDPDFQQRAKLPEIVRRQIPIGTTTPATQPASSATNPTAPAATAASAPAGR